MPNARKIKLAYLVSHPIQYQVPLLRRIAQEDDIDLTVFFGSDFSLRSYEDAGFGISLQWDVPLLGGYRHEFLPVIRDSGRVTPFAPLNYGIAGRLKGFDLLWVHGYAGANAMHGMISAKGLGIPVLLRSDSTLVDRPRSAVRLAMKEIFFAALRPFVSGVLSAGTLNAAYWRHYLGVDVPMWTMPYAVDRASFQAQTAHAQAGRADLQNELRLVPGRPVILFASKLQERKRCIDLLDAYLLLVARERVAPYLVIVGDGEERAALESRVTQSGVDGVRFCGFKNQTELPRFFDLATVFVLPSRHEPWGLVVNEAMSAGLPVIVSSDVGCQPDLVTDGVEGYVFPVGNAEALADALGRMVRDPAKAREMGEKARQRVAGYDFEADVRALREAASTLTRRIFV